MHEAFEQVFLNGDWVGLIERRCAELMPDGHQQSQNVLMRRAILGWLTIRHELMDDWAVVSAEKEWSWEMTPGLVQQLRIDRVLRRKSDGALAILDFKTKTSLDKNWIERQLNSEQTHLYIRALSERANEWVVGMIYEGILIGKMDEAGQQVTPFLLGYVKKNSTEILPKWSAGASRVSVESWPDAKWLEWVQPVLAELYVTTGLLSPSIGQQMDTRTSTMWAEVRWHKKLELIEEESRRLSAELGEFAVDQVALVEMVERNPDSCLKYGWEYACPYYNLCWNGAIPDHETFGPRVDHHETEV
jgi:hypothetical protein